MHNTQNPPQNSNFIKSMIRIAHPDWTMEQIEAEAQKQLSAIMNNGNDANCEYCSS